MNLHKIISRFMCTRGHTHSSRPAASEVAGRATKRKCPLSPMRIFALHGTTGRNSPFVYSRSLAHTVASPAATVCVACCDRSREVDHQGDPPQTSGGHDFFIRINQPQRQVVFALATGRFCLPDCTHDYPLHEAVKIKSVLSGRIC